jgi:hypothetical protein
MNTSGPSARSAIRGVTDDRTRREEAHNAKTACRPRDRSDRLASLGYRCDGRVYCSQMTSCEEAEFFRTNCPGVKMDGGGDGVPCEKPWCGDR